MHTGSSSYSTPAGVLVPALRGGGASPEERRGPRHDEQDRSSGEQITYRGQRDLDGVRCPYADGGELDAGAEEDRTVMLGQIPRRLPVVEQQVQVEL
jgi:hypothetical protein